MPDQTTRTPKPTQDQPQTFVRGNAAELLGQSNPAERRFFCQLCGCLVCTTRDQLRRCSCGGTTWDDRPPPSTRPAPPVNGEPDPDDGQDVEPPAAPPPVNGYTIQPEPAWDPEAISAELGADGGLLAEDRAVLLQRQAKIVRLAHRYLAPKTPPAEWRAHCGIDLAVFYDLVELSGLMKWTVAADEHFAVHPEGRRPWWRTFKDGRKQLMPAAQFLPLVPVGETREQRDKRREAFKRRQKREARMTMLDTLPIPTAVDWTARLASVLTLLADNKAGGREPRWIAKRVRDDPFWQRTRYGGPMSFKSRLHGVCYLVRKYPEKFGQEIGSKMGAVGLRKLWRSS
jgi:hypothetical protein